MSIYMHPTGYNNDSLKQSILSYSYVLKTYPCMHIVQNNVFINSQSFIYSSPTGLLLVCFVLISCDAQDEQSEKGYKNIPIVRDLTNE